MKMAIGSDSTSNLTTAIMQHLESKGIELALHGALAGKQADYVDAAQGVAEAVASGDCEQGLLFCYTGTGVTIIAKFFYGFLSDRVPVKGILAFATFGAMAATCPAATMNGDAVCGRARAAMP